MNRVGFKELIETVANGKKVWIDVVPEKRPLPAFTYSHITGGGSRILSGKRVNQWDTWRVRVIGTDRYQTDAMINDLKGLDNSSSEHFKNVFIDTIQAVPSEPDDKTVSSFVDFRVNNRGS